MKISNVVRRMLLVEAVFLVLLGLWAGMSLAQGTVFRCKGNEYVANIKDSKNGECKPMEGGNVTVVQGTKVNATAGDSTRVSSAPTKSNNGSNTQRTESSSEQRSRDSDAKLILESELKRAEAKQAELLKEYNNGEPDRGALDIKMPQRYIDRVAEMKASIARISSDIEGIKRELGRNSGSSSKSN